MSRRRYETLRAFFEDTRLRQDELAVELGVSASAVSTWVKGTRVPQAKTALRLAERTGVPLAHILQGKVA